MFLMFIDYRLVRECQHEGGDTPDILDYSEVSNTGPDMIHQTKKNWEVVSTSVEPRWRFVLVSFYFALHQIY